MIEGTEPPRSGGSAASATERVRIDLAYDGTGLHGFAENVGVDTVGGRLRTALEQVLGVPVTLTCSGRTDAGVHARSQVVTFDLPEGVLEPERLRRSLNSMLGPAIAVSRVGVVDADFDARFSATWRSYRYLVLARDVPDPFLARTSWWVQDALDLDAMRSAAAALVGEHDFSSFCRRPKGVPNVSLVRRVLHADWVPEPEPGLLRFDIVATAFCHQMVRSIVGTLVDHGRGRPHCTDVAAVLRARDRSAAGNIAPPHGLCLWGVGFGGDPPPVPG